MSAWLLLGTTCASGSDAYGAFDGHGVQTLVLQTKGEHF